MRAAEELFSVLSEIKARLEYLEKGRNQMFELIENDTLMPFHIFNLNLKQYKEEFNRHSPAELLQYKEIMQTYLGLSQRLLSLLLDQRDYFESVMDDEEKLLKKHPTFFYFDFDSNEVIGYYAECLKNETDKNHNPLYTIASGSEYPYLVVDETRRPTNYNVFNSDTMNNTYYKGVYWWRNYIKQVYFLASAICSYPDKILFDYNPTQEDILDAIELEQRQYARVSIKKEEQELQRKAQRLKPARNVPIDSDAWGKVMEEEDELFELAILGELEDNKERRFDDIFKEQREQMTDNASLLQKIQKATIDGKLFDFRLSVETYNLLSSLTSENLELFYNLVLRRNIIQREMFPELKAQFDEWLNGRNESEEEGINTDAPKINLQQMLKQPWFAEVRSSNKFDATWTDAFVEALMASEHGEKIAREWYDNGKHGQCNYIRGYIVGLLKDNGVLSRNYVELAKILKDSTGHAIARDYLGRGKKQPYAEWVKEYVTR